MNPSRESCYLIEDTSGYERSMLGCACKMHSFDPL